MLNLFLAPAPFDFTAIFGNLVNRWYYYVVLVVAITLLILYTIKKKKKRNELSNTQKLVYTAILSALTFLANYFTIKVNDSLQISLVALVGLVAGYMLGSGLGFTSAFIGDFQRFENLFAAGNFGADGPVEKLRRFSVTVNFAKFFSSHRVPPKIGKRRPANRTPLPWGWLRRPASFRPFGSF